MKWKLENVVCSRFLGGILNKKIDIFSFSSFFLILLIDSGEIQRTGNKGDYKQQQQDFTS